MASSPVKEPIMTEGSQEAAAAVWIGRLQPYHIGHLAILQRSLDRLANPHIVALVCHDWRPFGGAETGSAKGKAHPFSAWERETLIMLTLRAEGLDSRVRVIYVPSFQLEDWSALSEYLPPNCIRCASNKDQADAERINVWRRLGWRTYLLDVSDIHVLTTTELKARLAQGADWRMFLHPATHEFFSSIEGATRLLSGL
jgi:nicotinamide mononucleotide adenylyltransferase